MGRNQNNDMRKPMGQTCTAGSYPACKGKMEATALAVPENRRIDAPMAWAVAATKP